MLINDREEETMGRRDLQADLDHDEVESGDFDDDSNMADDEYEQVLDGSGSGGEEEAVDDEYLHDLLGDDTVQDEIDGDDEYAAEDQDDDAAYEDDDQNYNDASADLALLQDDDDDLEEPYDDEYAEFNDDAQADDEYYEEQEESLAAAKFYELAGSEIVSHTAAAPAAGHNMVDDGEWFKGQDDEKSSSHTGPVIFLVFITCILVSLVFRARPSGKSVPTPLAPPRKAQYKSLRDEQEALKGDYEKK
jgi:hypothetical protein